MARQISKSGREAGILSRGGELYTGGPPEALLQQIHPAARFLSMLILLLGVSLCQHPLALLFFFWLANVVAIVSYLNLASVYRAVTIPVLLLAVPSCLVASLWYKLPPEAGAIFFLRTVASVTVASVMLHSIGLRRMQDVFKWFKLPFEIRQIWSIMISQVAGFSDLLNDMAQARRARAVSESNTRFVRRQIGRQMGILFSRTCQRGNELAYAIDARRIADIPHSVLADSRSLRWSLRDHCFIWAGATTSAAGALL